MVTIESLLKIAAEASQAGDLRTEEQAMTAAQWMEEEGLSSIAQIGPFGGKEISNGQKVRIKKGAVIISMHPKYTRNNPKVAGRDYTVTVHRVDAGYINSHWHSHKRHEAVRNQNVVWAGEGGYWSYADTADVEIISEISNAA